MAIGSTKVIQVTNIAPQATKDQMQTLFGYLGKIEDIRLYPTIRDVSCPVQSRICYIKFMDSTTVGISQHMTNTVFIDRALIVIPVQNGEIPDEYYALEMTRNGTIVPGLHVNEPKLPPHVVNSVQGVGSEQVIITTDPQLESSDLPTYPPLPGNYDTSKVEETRRTITVQNIDPSTSSKDIIEYFSKAGEVRYLRSATRTLDNSQIYLIEFSDQPSILNALKLHRTQLNGRIIDIQHATQAIVKPQAKSNEAAQKEIEEAMSRFKEAQNMISASIEPVIGMLTKDKRGSRRSRSRSRGRRRRSRSRSRGRRSGSRSRGRRHRSRTRSRDRKRRSRSRKRSRSKSRTSKPRKSRSKSPYGRRKSRSRDRSKGRRRSRDRKEKEKRDRSKTKEKESKQSKSEREKVSKEIEKDNVREKSPERESKPRESKEKKSDKESSVDTTVDKKRSRSRSKYRSRSRDRKKKRRSRSRGKRRTPSPKHRRRSRSRSRDRKKEKYDKKERKERDKTRDRSRSHSKVPRNYDEEEKGFEKTDNSDRHEKESSEKSDNMDISNSP